MPAPPRDENTWTATVGPGETTYTVGYKAGLDDVRFHFENDASYIDFPLFLRWNFPGNPIAAQAIDQAKRDILGYPLVLSAGGGTYLSRVTPMTALPFLQALTGRPYLFATSLEGTGWGQPTDANGNPSGAVKDPLTQWPVYKQAKATVHFETLTYDVLTDAQMVALGFADVNGNPDESTLARYVTVRVMPGMEYLTLPQGGFQFVNTGNKPVPGTAGKLTPNYDLSLTWELVPRSCVGTALLNPQLENPPIDLALGAVNLAPFPNQSVAGTPQQLLSAEPAFAGSGYHVLDVLTLVGGTGTAATVRVTAINATGDVESVEVITPGSYTPGATPTDPVSTTGGVGSGCTLDCTFTPGALSQLMTSRPTAPGTGYKLGDLLTLSGGTFTTAAVVRVVALNAAATTGGVLAVEVDTAGAYTAGSEPTNPVSVTGGAGSGCELACEFGAGLPPGTLLLTGATITPIRSATGDRLYQVEYRFKYLPQGVQKLYYQGTPAYPGGATVNISNVSGATPPVVTTSAAHGFSTGQTVVIQGVAGATWANGVWQVTKIDATHFSIPATAGAAYTGGGTVAISGAYQDAGYYEVTTNGQTNIGAGLYNNDQKFPPVNIYPWHDHNLLFRVPD